MAKYECKFMTKELQNEIDGLMQEHGRALTLYGFECGMAGAEGYRDGLRNRVVTGVLVGVAAGVVCSIVKRLKKKHAEELKKETEVS